MLPLFACVLGSAAAVAPTLSTVVANGGSVGDIAGGYTATLTGTGFTGATGVTFGGTAATSVSVSTDSSLTCTVPAHATGAVSVVVTTPAGSNGANTAWEYFSPAQLTLSGWYRGISSGVMIATASAGTSGSNSLSAGSGTVTNGTAVNGAIPAHFDGSSSLTSSAIDTTHFSTAAAHIIALAKITSPAGSDNANTINVNGIVACNGEGAFQMGHSTAGLRASVYDGAYEERSVTCGVTAWHCMSARYDSTSIYARVDGGAESTLSAGACTNFGGAVVVLGKNQGGAAFITGDIMEIITAKSALSVATQDKIRAYFATRYQVSV